MVSEPVTIGGVVKNGVVVPEGDVALPEGTRVGILLPVSQMTPDEQAEFSAWELAGDEAWAMIDKWEKEEQS